MWEIYWGGVVCCWNATDLSKKVVWNKRMGVRIRDWRTAFSFSFLLCDHGASHFFPLSLSFPNYKKSMMNWLLSFLGSVIYMTHPERGAK